MPGVLSHVIAAILCLIIVHLMHYKWEYSLAIFIGNFVPDAIKFGFSGIKQGTLLIFSVEKDGFYQYLSSITSSYANWVSTIFFVVGTLLLLYHFHYIKKRTVKEYSELWVFLLVGIVLHLIMDALIIEKGIWI